MQFIEQFTPQPLYPRGLKQQVERAPEPSRRSYVRGYEGRIVQVRKLVTTLTELLWLPAITNILC